MDKNITVSNWRNFFEHSGDSGTTFKLFIETAYGCHGSCHGCPIPILQRTATDPKWDLKKLEEHLASFAIHLLQFRKKPIHNLAITIGPGENLFFSADYLKELAIICKNFKKLIGATNFHLAVNTSGLFSESKLAHKISAMKEVLNKNELTFAFVINLRQFEKTPEHYYRFAKLLMENINLVELEINMDQAVGEINNLNEFSKFVKSFPFVQLDFAYAINDGNVVTTYLKNNDFYLFIKNLRELTNSQNFPYFSQWHTKLNPIPDEEFNFYDNFQAAYDNITQNSIRLNSMGEWHFTKNILGTIFYDQNLGFKPLSTGFDNPFKNNFKKELSTFFQKQLVQHMPCDICKWKNSCLNSGFLTYTKFAPQNEKTCTNPAITIFEDIL